MKQTFLVFLISLASGFAPIERGEQGTIFISKDEGSSWTRLDTGLPADVTITGWINIDGGIMISTEKHGVYTAHAGLTSWHSANRGLPANLEIKTLATHGTAVFAGSYLQGVYVSHDAGNSWQKSSEGLGERSVRCLYSLGSTLYAGTDTGIYRSINHGVNWSIATHGMQVNDFTSWGCILYAATNFGLLRSSEGLRWTYHVEKTEYPDSWAYRPQALFNISADRGIIYSVLPDGHVYTSTSGSNQSAILTAPFTQYTFRLTPLSSPMLRASWRQDLRPLREQGSFKGRGLPNDKPFHQILKTPIGILVAQGRGKEGC